MRAGGARAPRYRARMVGPAHGAKPSRLRELAEAARSLEARLRLGGGPDKAAKQHAQGKLTARERIAALERQRTDIDAALEELREGSRMIENLLAQKGTAADAV